MHKQALITILVQTPEQTQEQMEEQERTWEQAQQVRIQTRKLVEQVQTREQTAQTHRRRNHKTMHQPAQTPRMAAHLAQVPTTILLGMETRTALLAAQTQAILHFRTPMQAAPAQVQTNRTTQEMPSMQLTMPTEAPTVPTETPPAPMDYLTATWAMQEAPLTQAPTASQAMPAAKNLCQRSLFLQVIHLLRKATRKKNSVAAVSNIARNGFARRTLKKVKSSRALMVTMARKSRKTC